MTEAANIEAIRLPFKRRKVIYKRDYNRAMEEVNRMKVLTGTLETVEMLETVRLTMVKTKADLDEVFLGLLNTIDSNNAEDNKFEEELLKERDLYMLNLDRAIGACITYRKKYEGGVRRDSLTAQPTGAPQASNSRLPKVGVPTFDGNIRKFLDYKALFENIVHLDDMVLPVRKMHYLKESLIGEAANTLANISVSDEGYKEAWGRVLAKYDNKRIIIHTHFNDLFNAEKIRSENQLLQLLDQIDVALRGLRACGEMTDRWNSILAYILYVRLDSKTRSDFDNSVVTNTTYYSFKDLWKFCEVRAANVEARKLEDGAASTSKPSGPERRSFLMSKPPCVVCQQGAHLLIDCAVFISKTPAERLKAIQSNRLCVNCFSKNHGGPACPSFKSCKICFQRHHYMLHLGEIPPTPLNAPTSSNFTTHVPSEPESASLAAAVKRPHGAMVLPSATVRFVSGRAVGEARVLLDNCSQPTLVADTFVRKFKIRTQRNEYGKPIRGVGFETVEAPRSCKLKLSSRVMNFAIDIEAEVIAASAIPYVLEHITWTEPDQKEVAKYALADTAFYSKNPRIERVDIILGAQYVEQCFLNETLRIQSLILRNTRFGWTINGEFPNASSNSNQRTTHVCCLTVGAIEKQVAEFLESKPSKAKIRAETNEFCEKYFAETTTRGEDGKFIVRLPFLSDPAILGSNRRKATAILNHSRRDEELECGYQKFMTEYRELGHMTAITPNRLDQSDYLIPHHAVIRPESTTTRIRVVFNASSIADSGYSLNALLAVGPQLQPELFDALVRFRQYKVAFTADIAMMYRCIWVHPQDRRYQRILWRDTLVEPIRTYELNTVTYGTAPAPFLAVRCLVELAKTIHESAPEAARAVQEHFYMDDLMTGAATVEEARHLREKIHDTLATAGLQLRKYQSNSSALLQTIPEDLWLRKRETPSEKVHTAILGIDWQCQSDTFRIKCEPSPLVTQNRVTKRQMLSEIAKIFDPLGFLAPVTVRAKLLVQRAWNEGVQWDDEISVNLTEEVKRYLTEITQLNRFQIDRDYQCHKSELVELIGFCNATEVAYGAVIYTKAGSEEEQVTRLVCAKTRIVSTKERDITKLQLNGAVLLVELAERIRQILNVSRPKVKLYTSSVNVFEWTQPDTQRVPLAVRHRVDKLREQFEWKFIDVEQNPAYLAAAGMTAQELLSNECWKAGPRFLKCPQPPAMEVSTAMERNVGDSAVRSVMTSQVTVRSIVDRISSYKRLLVVLGRVIAFVRRWKAARPNQVKYTFDNCNLMQRAKIAVVLILQAREFATEIQALKNQSIVASSSQLRTLDPFLDEEGVLRVRGRLAQSEFSFAKRHPVILPNHSHFLKMYVKYVHETFCHASKSFIMNFILAEYWVCGGLHNRVKAVINSCVVCARYRADTFQQIMGQLPATRVTPSRAFSNTGLDFCGPFQSKCVGHRSIKSNKVYACIFVCMTTRAVHIEVVSNLSTTHFLMALHRFVGRRGLPRNLYSDCGTNFVGANHYLNLQHEDIQRDDTTFQINWIFNPPRAPHRGGVWEAAVKSAKAHVTRVIGEQRLSFEELVTLFTRVEAILNSRPLCYRATSTSGEFILTPSHFLLGSPTFTIPEPETCRLPLWRRYELLRTLTISFWRVWRGDYLNMLQKKPKWQHREPNIQVGQVVLLKTEAGPGQWPFAIVENVFMGADGFVRTVSVRTAAGSQFKRDIRQLVKLPLDSTGVNDPPGGGHVDTSAL